MICYKKKKKETDCFSYFLNLVGVWEDFPTELYSHPPYLHSFSDFAFEEVVGAEEPMHWGVRIKLCRKILPNSNKV